MASIRALHIVCLFSFLLSTWRADCQTSSQLSCSEHLGASKLSILQPPLQGNEPQVCVSNLTCCTRQTENTLRVKATKKIKTHIQTKYSAAKSSLLSLFDELKGYFQSVVREGHRQSISFLLINTQKNITTVEVNVISTFFKALENYVVDDKVELQDIVNTFFRDSFPLVLEFINPAGKTLSNSYRQCLKTNMESIEPFGKRPAQLVGIYEQVFEPVRQLLNSMKFGVELMNLAQQFNFSSGCKDTLVQMKFCSLCQGVEKVKPCYSYCKDTLRKCLTSEIQLQTEWGLFIEKVYLLAESIGKSNLENFSNTIYKDLWSAAMYVLLKKQNVMNQVLDKCGTPSYIDVFSKDSLYTPTASPTAYVKIRLFAKMNSAKLGVFVQKSFYEGLPEEVCVGDELSAKQEDFDNCWNGKSVGRFTGLDSNPADFQMSIEEAEHLKLLLDKIREKNGEINKFINENEIYEGSEGDESGSGSGSGDRENGSGNCVGDDEDCISGSGSNEIPEDPLVSKTIDNDIYFPFSSTTAPDNDDNMLGGGVHTSARPGNVQARGNVSSTLTSSPFCLPALLLFVLLIRNWQS